jgi:hypothetical protein
MIKKYIFIAAMLVLVLSAKAQIPQQLNYQGIARNASGEPISTHVITVRLSIIDSASNGIVTYQETKTVSTNYVGLFTIVIGAPGGTNVIGTIASINWSTGKKYIKLEIDPNGASNFSLVGMNQLQSVPFALAAEPVGPAAGDFTGSFPAPTIANGAVSLAKLNPLVVTTINGKLSISDTATMLLPYVKQTALTTLLSNTVRLSDFDLKENTANKSVTTTLGNSDVLFPTQNAVKTYVDAAIATTAIADASITDAKIISLSGSKLTGTVAIANGGTGASTIATAKTNLALNNVDNTTDVNKPISLLTQAALDLKENTANKSIITTLGTSDVLFPTQNAVKTYVDAAVAGVSITDGSITDSKIISVSASKLTGVVAVANGGTGASTVAAAKTNLALNNVDNTSDVNKPISTLTQAALNAKENTANKSITTTLGTSDVLFPTQNAVKTYVDAAVAGVTVTDGSITDSKIISVSASKITGTVAIANGGTGASTVAAAKTNLALNNVDNTSDVNKPISLLTQAALDLKENAANKSVTTTLGTSDVLFPTQNAVKTYVDAAVAGVTVTDGSITDSKIISVSASKITGVVAVANGGTGAITIAAAKTNLALNNVDNTSDVNKPISLLTQAALDLKENTANKSVITTLGTSDVLFPTQNAVKTYVDAAVAGVSITDGSITDSKIISLSASKLTGTVAIANGGTGANTVAAAKTNLALNNVDNTSDVNKPISTLTQAALDLKENTANKSLTTTLGTSDVLFPTQNAVKTYVDAAIATTAIADASITDAKIISLSASKLTGTVAIANGGTGASTVAAAKTNLALNNVDNTSDVNKPISTLTQTALNAKENAANKSITITLGTSDVLFPTQNAVKTYVDAAIATTAITDASITDAKIISLSASKLTGTVAIANGGTGANTVAAAKTNFALNNVDNTSDVNKPISTLTQAALDLKENTANKSVTTTLGTSDVLFPTQNAVKTYVDAAIATTAIADASITDAKIISVSASKLTGVVPVAKGGTGSATLTSGYVKAGVSEFTTSATIPVNDVTGAIKKVNGVSPDANGDLVLTLSLTYTGIYNGGNFSPTVPTPANSNIYIVSSDPTPSNNGRTFIYDGAVWREITANQASTDARYLRLDGGTLVGDLTVAATKKITITDQPASATDAANKSYVDAAVAGATIADGSITNAKIVSMATSKLTGTVAIANGGTGASTIAAAKTNLLLNNVDNTTDVNKPISTLTQSALDTKENTANKSINTALGTSDVLFPSQKAVKTYVDAAVAATAIADASITDAKIISLSASKLTGTVAITNGGTGASTAAAAKTNLALNNVDNTTDVNKPISTLTQSALDTKENTANKSINTALGTSDVLFPSQKAVKTYVDAAIATTVIADASITDAKIISLSGSKVTGVVAIANGGTGASTAAAAKTNLALNNVDNTSDVNKPISTLTGAALNAKENIANKSVTTTLGTSDVLFPTQNAVKTYVDAAIATTVIADGSITNAKIISLAATKLTGVLAVANGGTGVATITGIVKGNGASAVTAAVNGTDFSLVREIADEFSATAGQTVFTLTQTKSANSKLKMFINGVRISNTAYALVGTTLTYTPASNASYALTLNDRIQFDYYY